MNSMTLVPGSKHRGGCDPGIRLGPVLRAMAIASLSLRCAGSDSTPTEVYLDSDQPTRKRHVPSFAEFKKKATVRELADDWYRVEWDLTIRTETALRRYYDTRFLGHVAKSAVRLTPSTGPDGQFCNQFPVPSNCVDNVYRSFEQLNLRYCIHDSFGTDKPLVVAAAAAAGQAWARAANVRFTYISTNDATCFADVETQNPPPPGVDFRLQPFFFTCGFFPYSRQNCANRPQTVMIDNTDDPQEWTADLAHEFGHVLGLVHEHVRPDVALDGCEEFGMRYLTDYDPNSVMGYPSEWGDCAIGLGNQSVTALDAAGVRRLYGMPVAWVNSAVF
jgi:hypothetical protein